MYTHTVLLLSSAIYLLHFQCGSFLLTPCGVHLWSCLYFLLSYPVMPCWLLINHIMTILKPTLAHWLPDCLCLARLILSICKPRLLLRVRFLVVVCAHTLALHHSSCPSHSPSLGHPWSAVLYWECSEHVQLRQCDHMHHAHAHCVQSDTWIHSWVHFCWMNKCGASSQKLVRRLGIIERHEK